MNAQAPLPKPKANFKETLSFLLPYLWPKDRADLRAQVIWAVLAMVIAKIITVLTPLALVWLFPLWMMIVFSTMPDNGIFSPGIELLPHDNFLANFHNLQRDTDFVGAIGISVSVAVTYTVLSIIGTMQLFTEPFLITERGGPGGGTETLGLLLYRQGFRSLNFGYASAVAYTMAGLAIAITLVQLWLTREPK